ncbi:MAG TPA: DHHA1 domain-containing protein [Promineifilum sp.]|nr:DHHA1 domain-containing protein [Promineifilum sp.]
MNQPNAMRPYYTDSTTLDFAAMIESLEDFDGRPAVLLEPGYFYPTSGGQPHDTGQLRRGDEIARVIDVVERESDGVALHILDRPLSPGPVAASIDRDRRLDHMRHHTGQHILSQAFIRVAEAETVGFHMSAQSITIDLDRADLSAAEIDRAEALANEVVWADGPVSVRFVTLAEAATLPLRKTPPGRDGRLRLIDIEGFDLTACGGTHVARTGEVGLIRIARTERRGGMTRVEFLCAGRALADYRAGQDVLRQLGAALTTGAAELPAAVARLQEENKALRLDLRRREDALLALEAAQLLAAAEPASAARLVRRVFVGRSPDEVRRLATALVEAGGVVALLGLAGERSHLVFARSADAPGDMGALVKVALAKLGGRGGGSPTLAQGGGPAADEAAVAAVLQPEL